MISRNGVLAAGNWIIDQVKVIESYPAQDELTTIYDQHRNNGGSPYNVLKDLAKLQASFPLFGVGLVGNDEYGKFIINDCKRHHIDTSGIHTIDSPTSYTDVMSVRFTGRRTFFHNHGANAQLNIEHFEFENFNAKIFHLGYLLLLRKLDEIDSSGRTAASRLFEKAKGFGFITTTDLVSEDSDRFSRVVPPSLPFVDYLFLNETEASKTTGIDIIQNGSVNLDRVVKAGIQLLSMGVNKTVFIHFVEGAVAISHDKQIVQIDSLRVPATQIKSSVGAGDAFVAGCLTGIHEEKSVQECLEYAVCTAASSLRSYSTSDGIEQLGHVLKLRQIW